MRWYSRPGVVYGFSAGAFGAAVVTLGILLIKFDVVRYEHLPPDAREVTQAPAEPIVRDAFSTGRKSSSPAAKVSPSSAPKHHKNLITFPSGVTGVTRTATGTATEAAPPPPAPAPPAQPLPAPVPAHTHRPPIDLPALPGVKVTIPPIIELPLP